ncbi:hypothetical protein AOG55_07190 [Acidiplasma cupricumulans]|uniref:Uncharacterized protein n=1 Tax=Acidiplasma cupricumulans TaxID=312540 RepID=A0A0Q0RIN4_9ARCH|nr:hypothetical protein AOG55_07190 [Acidiplasma cupricumulans]
MINVKNVSYNAYYKDMNVHFYLNFVSDNMIIIIQHILTLTVATKFVDPYTFETNYEGYPVSAILD